MSEARRVQTLLGGLFVLIALVAVSVGVWLRLTRPAPIPPPPTPSTVRIYIPHINNQGELLRYEPKTVTVRNPGNAYREAFEHLISQTPVFPEGTRLLSAELKGDTLELNFSAELVRNFEGGSDTEAALINAITRSASSFPGVQKVQILIEGKPVESIGGHLDILQPLPVQGS
ncbi:MAG: GerMN domain-containing protein [Fimbriimonadales bacterium]|nr:GerMN domain-containing protein [Fimbriimonadales bacterium]